MKPTTLLKAAALIALAPMAAFAQDDMDANGDGVYSYDEMLAVFPDLAEETFIVIDANQDGLVDAEEFQAAKEAGLVTVES